MMHFRRTLLDEYQTLAGLWDEPHAEDFRVDVGSFVIEYISYNGRVPSYREIVKACISADELKDLDVMHEYYKKLINGEIAESDYKDELNKKLISYC